MILEPSSIYSKSYQTPDSDILDYPDHPESDHVLFEQFLLGYLFIPKEDKNFFTSKSLFICVICGANASL